MTQGYYSIICLDFSLYTISLNINLSFNGCHGKSSSFRIIFSLFLFLLGLICCLVVNFVLWWLQKWPQSSTPLYSHLVYCFFAPPPIKRWSLCNYPFNMDWLCNLPWPIGCNGSDSRPVLSSWLRSLMHFLFFSSAENYPWIFKSYLGLGCWRMSECRKQR